MELFGNKHSRLVWRKKKDDYAEKNLFTTDKYGGGSGMLCFFLELNFKSKAVCICQECQENDKKNDKKNENNKINAQMVYWKQHQAYCHGHLSPLI